MFALGCSGPSVPVQTDVNVEATSCVDGALSMSFDVVSTNTIFPGVYVYGSSNVIPIPAVTGGGTSFHVVAALDTVAANEQVSMTFTAGAFPNATISIANIQFYTAPPAQAQIPACPPEHALALGTGDSPGLGFHMEVSNAGTDPLVIDQLELAQTPTLLSGGTVRWGGSDFEGLAWTPAMPGGIVIPPGTPPLMVDLPDTPSPGTQGVLMRYAVHSSSGMETRAAVQVDLNAPVATEPTTWGRVKALYRNK